MYVGQNGTPFEQRSFCPVQSVKTATESTSLAAPRPAINTNSAGTTSARQDQQLVMVSVVKLTRDSLEIKE